MQDNIQIFEHSEFGKIRTIDIDGQSWLVGKDIAKSLGYSNASKAIINHVDCEDKIMRMIPHSQNGNVVTQTALINESGLYSLILSSKLPAAKAFKRWVTSEVLPSIRKHGAYITDDLLDQLIDNPESAVKLIAKLKDERSKKAALEGQVEMLTPKAHYYDVILQCPGAVLTSVIAKDYGYSCVKFNRLLHALGIQFRYKTNKTWLLYHEHDNNGYTITNTYHHNGNAYILMCWTQKGRRFLYDFLAGYGILPKVEINNEPDAVS